MTNHAIIYSYGLIYAICEMAMRHDIAQVLAMCNVHWVISSEKDEEVLMAPNTIMGDNCYC